jgi:hypothetical protein
MKQITANIGNKVSASPFDAKCARAGGAGKSHWLKHVAAAGAALLLATAFVWGQAAVRRSSPKPDLGSPEATVVSFTKAVARGETNLAQACFLPGGVDYDDMRQILASKPGSPHFEIKQMFESLNLNVPMPIVVKTNSEHGTKVVWRVTFKKEFKPHKGPVFKPGSTYDFDATLKPSGKLWLIDNF